MHFFDQNTLSYFFIGIAAFVVTQTVYTLLARPIVNRIELNRRMKMILSRDTREIVFAELMKARGLTTSGGYRYPFMRKFNILVVQSGLLIGIEAIIFATIAIGLITVTVLTFATQFRLIFSLPIGILSSLTVIWLFLTLKRQKRRNRFAEQLPDALELIARSLKAGHPLPIALTLAAREMPDPLGSEIGILSDELAYGFPIAKALRNLQVRVGQEDLGIFATGIIIQTEVGGNLIELMASLSSLMRERVKMRRKVRVLTSEGRMSGLMLSLLPVFIFVALNLVSPKYYGAIWEHASVTIALTSGLIWMTIGNIVIYRMVNFRY